MADGQKALPEQHKKSGAKQEKQEHHTLKGTHNVKYYIMYTQHAEPDSTVKYHKMLNSVLMLIL